ncbi:MobF family relaxase [Jiangella anatolica]|uniref:MobF family relaxase n=1 Tax=Jiangella anatolica TaxID=2670374 RepID=UPI0026A6A35A
MRVMSAGDGYKYLAKTIAAADGDRSLSTPLTRYYAEKGTPPGWWLGSGLVSLGGPLTVGDRVSEPQLQLLIGMGRHPLTGQPLGRAHPAFRSIADRIQERVADLDTDLGPAARAHAVEAIEAEETERGTRRVVAGFDFTFSIPKSASVVWAVADAGTQTLIAQAHHAAIADVVAFMEREVAATRVGATAGDGAVAQVDVTGAIATAFDHYDSRAGDPHLHTHVVISNKVQAVLDEKWRALDGRPMHAATVALSELHEALFADHLTRTLGVEWEQRERGRDRNPAWAITTVPPELVAEFSSRSRNIDAETDRLIDSYVAAHGRRPSRTTILRLRAQATLATRPKKEVRSLAELTSGWRSRASRVLRGDATGWAQTVTLVGAAPPLLRADDIPLEVMTERGLSVMETVGEKRSTWRRWNLYAEAARQTMGWRFATTADREAVIGLVVDAAERESLRLTPPELAPSPAAFQRPDGTTVFRPKHSTVFSSHQLLAAEDRLLDRSRDTTGPALALGTIEAVTRRRGRNRQRLDAHQAAALTAIAMSGRVIDVLVGPAGTGKTTAMHALRRAWEREHGPGSVVGLAPSAAAADVLAGELGIQTENTAKWWHDHQARRTTFTAGQLVIVDEASLAGTLSLDRITAVAELAGAKVLLVGDYAQLQSVDAGGAFSLLVHDRDDTPDLLEVHRFTHPWERTASLQLRHANADVIDTYIEHGRILDGDTDEMVDAAYTAWRADALAGKTSVLITEARESVTELNLRARIDLILDGTVNPDAGEVALHDGAAAAVGDTIITRRNERRLRTGNSWVRNGDRWTVTAVRPDGSLTARRAGRRRGGAVVLPAGYVAEHVDLGYAITAHRAQGITTDTAHVLVLPTTTRENLYVALTRGRELNMAYVATDLPDTIHTGPHPTDNPEATARSVLYGVLQHVGAELSAHETVAAEHERWASIAQLAAEYETIAAAAQHDRWSSLIRACGLGSDGAESALTSDAFGALAAELRRAEANHHDIDALLPQLAQVHGFDDAEDVAAVLHERLARATERPAPIRSRTRATQSHIVGLISEATGPMGPDMRAALTRRRALIEARAEAVLDAALHDRQAWAAALGSPPADRAHVARWRLHARTVAAYRDRYGITTSNPLGATPQNTAQKIDAARAAAALDAAQKLSSPARRTDAGTIVRDPGPVRL